MMIFDLPYPPTINTYWKHRVLRRRPIVYVSDAGVAYRTEIKRLTGIVRPLDGDLVVVVNLYPPDRRRRDIDNPIKALLDAMTHAGIWHDDSQIKKLTVEMMPKLGGRTIVSVGLAENYGM